MAYLVYFNLSGAELGSVSVFSPEEALIPISFVAHPYSRFMVLGFTFVGIVALLYGLQGAKPGEQMVSFWALASAIGVAFANDFITMFLFWELLTITTSGLIFLHNTRQSFVMGYRFLLFHLIGGLMFFLGIIQHYSATGSTILAEPEAGLIFFLLGFGFKAAFIPFHIWVVWGYPSASLFSSVLLAGLTTKIGVYAVARILGPHEGIVFMGGVMALMGVCCALMQKNMRRLLSYHIVSQVGYMVAGVGLGASLAVDGGLFHLGNNLVYKTLLFMTAGAVLFTTGTESLHDLTHQHESKDSSREPLVPVWRAMPLVTAGAVIGAAAIAGLPLFSGYASKYMLKVAMEGAGPAEWMLLAASVGTAASFCKFVYFGFIKARARITRPPAITMQIPIVVLSLLCVILGIKPGLTETVLPYGSSYKVYSPEGVGMALLLAGGGTLFFAALARPLQRGISLPSWVSLEYLVFIPLGRFLYRGVRAIRWHLENAGRNIKNINVDQLIVGMVLICVMIILFYYGRIHGF